MNPIISFRQNGITVLRVCRTNFDASLAREFLRAIATFDGEWPPIIVDLSTVEFIDTSGLSALCNLARNEGTRPVYLAGVSGRLARGLARVPRAQHPPCHETVADALLGCEYAEVIEEDHTGSDQAHEWVTTHERVA